MHMPSISVVGSNPELLESLEQLFLRAGFKASIFSQSSTFIERLKEEEIDCLLIEALDTKSATLEVLEKILENLPNTPVIVIGGSTEPADAIAALRAGAIDYVQTPFIDRILVETIQNAVASQ